MEILLIEDNPADAQLLEAAAAETGLADCIRTFETGEAALDALEQRLADSSAPLPDLVLLDLNLPGIDGKAVLKAIRENRQLTHLPVLVLTTSDDYTDVIASYELHANAFMTKPLGLDGFVDVVEGIESFWFSLARLPSERPC